jgi:2-amino-4-hydroxy-6-hydroxymethyldihydropteridine diphosphokinase
MTAKVFLGLGSNLGERLANLQAALGALPGPALELRRVSSVYESEPVGPIREQGTFLNAVAELRSGLGPRALLGPHHQVEARLGRRAGLPQGPRLIDLDLLLFGERVETWPELVLPHPELGRRAFVLAPLLELDPGLRDPRSGTPLAELLGRVKGQSLRRLEGTSLGPQAA